jgi:nicotinate-nucleotide adenylyltransferase
MKRILMFPGAFNPPHNGHVAVAETAVKELSFDEVWIVPSGRRDDKAISTSYEDRRNLGSLFVEHLRTRIGIPVRLVTNELDDVQGRPTHKILKEIRMQDDMQVMQLIGLDGFLNVRKHADSDEAFVVVKRSGYELPDDFISDEKAVLLDVAAPDISSTQIRSMVQDRDNGYRELLPDSIADYIHEHNLYV